MSEIKACFIIEDGKYIEVPAERVLENGKYRDEFKDRFFYPFDDYLLEMSREDRRFFYACAEAMKNTVKQPKRQVQAGQRIEVVSLEELIESMGDGNMRMDFFASDEVDVTELVERKLLTEDIALLRGRLTAKEDSIIREYYENQKTDKEIGEMYGMTERTMNNWRRRILGKLLNLLKNE